ncbi:MAG: phosphatase [Dorea sp.]
MRVEIDTHSHTLISGHAYSTIREMAKMASEKGLKGLAITEHAPEMPGSTHLFYFQNLKVVPRNMYGVDLLMGGELNIMDEEGTVDLPDGLLPALDIRIASMHIPCYKGEKTKEGITRAYINVMERGDIDIIGHPDDGRYPVDYEELVKAAKRTGTLLEVNNASLSPKGFRKNTKENTLEMLKYCKKYETMIVVGTDAHVDEAIAEYPYVEEVLQMAQFPEELIANKSLEKLRALLKCNKKG